MLLVYYTCLLLLSGHEKKKKQKLYGAVFRNVFQIEGLGLKRDIDLSSKHLNMGQPLWAKVHVYG